MYALLQLASGFSLFWIQSSSLSFLSSSATGSPFFLQIAQILHLSLKRRGKQKVPQKNTPQGGWEEEEEEEEGASAAGNGRKKERLLLFPLALLPWPQTVTLVRIVTLPDNACTKVELLLNNTHTAKYTKWSCHPFPPLFPLVMSPSNIRELKSSSFFLFLFYSLTSITFFYH